MSYRAENRVDQPTSSQLPGMQPLRVLNAVAQHLNFSKAADVLGLTPAAVSYQVKEIESRLGFSIFERTSRRVSLTEAGRVYLVGVDAALSVMYKSHLDALHIVTQEEEKAKTTLTISVMPRFATNWLFPRLPEFKALYPDADLVFDVTDKVRCLAGDKLDIAIRFGCDVAEPLQQHRLFSTEVIPVCRPALARTIDLHDLGRLTNVMLCYVDCQTEGRTWPDWLQWFANEGVEEPKGMNMVGLTDLSHVVQTVLEAEAVGLVEPKMVEKELAKGQLVRLSDKSLTLPTDLSYKLVFNRPSLSKLGERFVEWIVQA
ncbi:LysR substrate-binding domain-containing protein [Thaumasiovibrio subtropicus]|uniref:LysR substrate-binding domain-containing protein n=1 Tax=Thaumasiovibrio subtropicus TaxID=1891207 RepID=UPI000B34E57A|nr:LysR substrate-binding domain-containing protein [Thaumasiovibrio subtropicus]